MDTIYDKIIKLLADNGIDYKANLPFATSIKNLVIEFSEPQKAIQLVKSDLLSKKSMEDGKDCPCCDQHVKLYPVKLNSLMAFYLVKLYTLTVNNSGNGYFHVGKEGLDIPNELGGGWAKVRWWGLIEEQTNDTDPTKRTSGLWRITELGNKFVEGSISVQKYVKLYNAKSYGFDGGSINIHTALGTKFNYHELITLKSKL